MAQYAATLHALEDGLANLSPEKAIDVIDTWIAALDGVDAPGAKGIARDLGSLKTALGKDEPDAERVQELVAKLGEATTKIAGSVDGAGADKLKTIGDGLSKTRG